MEREKRKKTSDIRISGAFKTGAISLAFLIIGYQVALFTYRAGVVRIASLHDHPDTVYVYAAQAPAGCQQGNFGPYEQAPDDWQQSDFGPYEQEPAASRQGQEKGQRQMASRQRHNEVIRKVLESQRKVESFRFNPNTVSQEDLRRLGFSEKQAASIINYREKGGRFRRKSDFARSYVVADSVFKRLEPYIDIPLTDINKADSTAFDNLPGIGGWFASKMVSYREELGGYSCKEQLMEIWNFDEQKYDGLKDLICCSAPADSFHLWSLPPEELRAHPHIRAWQTAKAIVFFREHNPKENWTIENLHSAGILTDEAASRLGRCLIAKP